MILYFTIIFFISFALAYSSMQDFGVNKKIKRFIDERRLRGSIVFFGKKVKHYSSPSSSELDESEDMKGM